jgi:hypothetical protein
MSSPFARILAATAMTLALGGTALAESPTYCNDYAREAVVDAHRNLEHGCRYGGARWTLNYDAHYSWCLAASRPAAVTERVARRDGMIACVGHP